MTYTRPIGVLGMGTYLPSTVRTNAEVAAGAGVTPEWISERTGVRERHVAAPGEAASDLAAHAVRSAVRAAGLDMADIGLLICGTSTPDELGPATACRIQTLTGADRAVALDVSAACSGWLFAAKVAHDWLRTAEEGTRYAVAVGVEAYSRFLDPADRGTAVLFADGAAAAVLGPVAEPGGSRSSVWAPTARSPTVCSFPRAAAAVRPARPRSPAATTSSTWTAVPSAGSSRMSSPV